MHHLKTKLHSDNLDQTPLKSACPFVGGDMYGLGDHGGGSAGSPPLPTPPIFSKNRSIHRQYKQIGQKR